jgi:hypothetical protein
MDIGTFNWPKRRLKSKKKSIKWQIMAHGPVGYCQVQLRMGLQVWKVEEREREWGCASQILLGH